MTYSPSSGNLITQRVVIIGAGQAAFSLAVRLRQLGFLGLITMIGDEPDPPYQRPPLSKALLLGETTPETIWLRPAEFYHDNAIDLKLDRRVSDIQRSNGQVFCSDGSIVDYDALVLATGARARQLPADLGGDLEGVFTVRCVAEAMRLKSELIAGRTALIVGGGYIGLEAAAVCRILGLNVVLIEAQDRILKRVAGASTAAFFRALHRDHGVAVCEGTALAGLEPRNGRVGWAELEDGRRFKIDLAIVGIGANPAIDLAERCGLPISNGVSVDALCRTVDPAIYAIGDCASFPHEGQRIRLESVGHAIDHAEVAAAVIAGGTEPYRALPWFWSDQYDVKLQIAGLNLGHTATVTRRSHGRSRSIWYYKHDRLIAVDAVDDPRAYMVGRRLIGAGRSPDPERIADPDVQLKSLLRS